MQVPLELSFRNVERTEELEALIRRKVARLEKLCDYMTSCRIAVERPHKRERGPGPYHVRIDIGIPGGYEIVARRDPSGPEANDLRTVVQKTFDVAERRLRAHVERQHGEVKHHDEPRAFVKRIFPDDGYGFLRTTDGLEIYFHRNAVAGDDFDRLAVGTEVRYVMTMGEEGPQATTVQIVSKPGVRAGYAAGPLE